MFFRQRTQKLYMRSDAHGERAQKVYALDYCAASFVTEGKIHPRRLASVAPLARPRAPRCGARALHGAGCRAALCAIRV